MSTRAQNGGGKQTPAPVPQLQPATISAKLKAAFEAWFGPGDPPPQNAPASNEPRALDYQTHYNIQRSPRAGETVGFEQLRNLADAHDLTRIIIETRKDQMEKQTGKWRLRESVADDDSSVDLDEKSDKDPRIQALTEFFRFPDQEHSWRQWLRMFMEEVLVIDAPSVWLRPTLAGDLYSLQLIDGTTIKRVIDEHGATPLPPNPAYQQIIKGVVAYEFTTDQMVYRPRNPRVHKVYGYSPVEQIIVTVNIALRRMTMQLAHYTDGNIPRALLQAPEDWSPEMIRRAQEWFDTLLSGNDANRSKLIVTPNSGSAPVFPQQETLKDEFDEWLARVVCFCFSVSPTPFIKQVNRATADSQLEQATEEGLLPLRNYVKDWLDLIVQKHLGFTDIEWTWDDDRQEDPLKQAQIDASDVTNGIRSRDEVREARGLAPTGFGLAVTTGSGVILLEDAKKISANAAKPQEPEPNDGGSGAQKLAKKKARFTVDPANMGTKVEQRIKKLTAVIEKFLRKQGKKLSRQIVDEYKKAKKSSGDDPGFSFLDNLNWSVLIDDVEKALERTAREIGSVVIDEFVTDPSADMYNLFNQRAHDWAEDRAAELVGMHRRSDGTFVKNPHPQWAITDTTRDELRSLITDAFEEGWTPQELADEIESSTLFSETRAELVARTEIGHAHIQGALLGGQASGNVTKKKSILSNLHDRDDECDQAAEDGWIPLERNFSNGQSGPLYHPNCECALLLDNDE